MSWRSRTTHLLRMSLPLAMLVAGLPLAQPTFASDTLVANADGAVQVKGKWTATAETSGFYGANYLFRTPGDGNSTVTWPFPSGTAGRYEVFARWSAGPNRATNATYLVSSNAGITSLPVNQKVNGGTWQSLGSFDFQPKGGQGVTMNDRADGVVVADAIRFVGPQ